MDIQDEAPFPYPPQSQTMIIRIWTCEHPDYGGDPVGQVVSDFAVTHSPEPLFWMDEVDDDYNTRVYSQWGTFTDTVPGTIEERPYSVSSSFSADVSNALNGMPSTQELPIPVELVSGVWRYRQPSDCCQSEDATIQALAESLVAGCGKEYEAVMKIMDWCSDNLQYTPDYDVHDALSILQDPAHRAVCAGYSHVAIALLRAVDIPARFVCSVVMPGVYEVPGPGDPPHWPHTTNKGSHATVEVYYPDIGWIPYCPTNGFYHYVDTHQYRACHGVDQVGDEIPTSILALEISVYLGVPQIALIDSIASQLTDGPSGLSYLVEQFPTPARRAYADYVEDAWVGVEAPDSEGAHPGETILKRSAPNPFGASTDIHYATTRGPSRVVVAIFDVAGRLVRQIIDDQQNPGNHRVSWDGTDAEGRRLPSGVYLYRVIAPGVNDEGKTVLLK